MDPYAAPEVSNWGQAVPQMVTHNGKLAIAIMAGKEAIAYLDPMTVFHLITEYKDEQS